MPTPVPSKTVKPSFGSDKAKKQKIAFAFGVAIVAIVLVFFIKKRKTVEDPVKTRQAKAELQATENAKDAPAPMGMQPGGEAMAPGAPGADDPFLKQMQDFKNQQQAQQADLKKAEDARQQQELQAARQQGTEAQRNQQGVPSSVGPDGTARQGGAAGQGQQVPEKNPAPPYAGYDTTSWIVTQAGRVRPAYETGEMYPVDPQQHAAMEQRWFNSFASPMVVGLDSNENAAMTRLKADTAGVQGSIGTGAPGLVVRGRVPEVKASRTPQGDAAHWGGWITVRPVDEPVKK
jgi:hypothetical protein